MNFCSECGSQLSKSTKFCPECGIKIIKLEIETNAIADSNSDSNSLLVNSADNWHLPYEANFFKRHPMFTFALLPFLVVVVLLGIIFGGTPESGVEVTSNQTIDESNVPAKATARPTTVAKPSYSPGSIGWYLKQPAQQYIAPGEGLLALNQQMGISLNNGTRPITVKELADQIYAASTQIAGRVLTRNDIDISLQPGNGLYTFLAHLLNGPESYQAIVYELLLMGSQHS